MRVTLFSCGPAANESELTAFQRLKSALQAEVGEGAWVLLSNVAFSVTNQLQSDEIDLVVIGPSGVRVVEIKHWTAQWVDGNVRLVEGEADRVTDKARKIGTTLRRLYQTLPRVDGSFLVTQESSKARRLVGRKVRGVGFYTLSEWKAAIGFDAPWILSSQEAHRLSRALQPQSEVAIDGSLRRLAGYSNLKLQTGKDEHFHRIYKAEHSSRRDRVLLHLYDLSASDDKNAETKSRREFDALRRLQLYHWAPRILDSYQEAPGYAGEMFFFTVVDPAAPSIADRAADETWTTINRVAFARNAVQALAQMHNAGIESGHFVHRNLTPKTIFVRFDNSPIFTGFEYSRIPAEVSVASARIPTGEYSSVIPPEVHAHGLAVADSRSDVYSLCACLRSLFNNKDDALSRSVTDRLVAGLAEQPELRGTLADLNESLSEVIGEEIPRPPAPPARFWTEDQVIRFRDRDYRIISRLGSGGVGTTFKVIERDRSTKEDLGTYVAKVANHAETGRRVLRAYCLARSHLRHSALSSIFEVASEWQENQFTALMTWISGAPLADFTGVFSLLAEDQQESSVEALALRWIRIACEALAVLHDNGLIHGDVSPRNLIVSGSNLVLTDYDFVCKIGDQLTTPATVPYCSPLYETRLPASPSDDIYSLAASFFHVVFDKHPFRYGSEFDKKRGLNWENIAREQCPSLAAFLDRATNSDPKRRFGSVAEVFETLKPSEVISIPSKQDEWVTVTHQTPLSQLREERIEWLRYLLQSYPGSQWGNSETRGLDTNFAAQTYVETALENSLLDGIRERRVRLIILCGNAGDGKTALLQHIAAGLGLGKHQSADRILEGKLPGGPFVSMNLDGSASWKGRSADEILDEFLKPFRDGPPTQDRIHLLAINDGRLMEWIDGAIERNANNEFPLATELYRLLQMEAASEDSHIRFITLNQRSLVGNISPDQNQIDTAFLDRLMDHLYGGTEAETIWSRCLSCSAQDRCEVFRAARLFGPDGIPSQSEATIRFRARQRLFEAMQAVHLRGEIHITMRELRAALVYILFGVDFCDDYHSELAMDAIPYWDRAFSADSVARQGDVLRELARFDPALEAHPQIDRYLLSNPLQDVQSTTPRYSNLALGSARRRAFFEWSVQDNELIAGDRNALDLARGSHLRQFRDLPLAHATELADVCERLCKGISRLEDLPPQAINRPGVVPLRITPRTPTETAFWVEKQLTSFHLEANAPPQTKGVERLHRQAFLTYRYRNNRGEERLALGAELFHLLLELADGYQLGDVSTDDTFAHLSIFVQRLVREDERELLAWNPMKDALTFTIAAVVKDVEGVRKQQMVIQPLSSEGSS